MVLSRFGVLLEIIGTILLASSLAGPERVARWEASIKARINLRGKITFLKNSVNSASELLLGCFVLAFILISLILSIFGGRGFLILSICGLLTQGKLFAPDVISSPCSLAGVRIAIIVAVVCLAAFFFPDSFAKIVKTAVAILASVLLTPLFILYFVVLLLWSPYLLAEFIAAKYHLRPVLGVLGTLIILTSLVLQFFQNK